MEPAGCCRLALFIFTPLMILIYNKFQSIDYSMINKINLYYILKSSKVDFN